MRSLIVILLTTFVSYSLCDVRSGRPVASVFWPLVFLLSLAALAVWVYVQLSRRGRGESDAYDAGGGGWSSSGAGDD